MHRFLTHWSYVHILASSIKSIAKVMNFWSVIMFDFVTPKRSEFQ